MPNSPESKTMEVHPAEERFLLYVRALKYVTIDTLEIQNGLPVICEIVKTKVKFRSQEEFLNYILSLKYGTIETLEIQNGLPVIAESVKVRVKFV